MIIIDKRRREFDLIGSIILGGIMIVLSLWLMILSWSTGDRGEISYSIYGLLLGTACIIGGILRKKRKQKQQERLGVEGEDI